MVLKPEDAKRKLKQWTRGEEGVDAFLETIEKLPKKNRSIAWALFGLDDQGREFDDWPTQRDYEQLQARVLEEMSPVARTRFLKQFFGRFSHSMELTWQHMTGASFMYSAYVPFRAPSSLEATRTGRFRWLGDMMWVASTIPGKSLDASWLAQWAPYLRHARGSAEITIARVLAAVIDQGGPESDPVFEILTQSAKNEHGIGSMGNHVTCALLAAARPEGWRLVEQLLVAAQRQEGLRRSIIESVSSAHPDAFWQIVGAILSNDLLRNRSIRQFVGNWFWMPESANAADVAKVTDQVLSLANDARLRKEALTGSDDKKLLLSLLVLATDDAIKSQKLAIKLLNSPAVSIRHAAARHIHSLHLPQSYQTYRRVIRDEDLRVAQLMHQMHLEEEPQGERWFSLVEAYYQRLPEKPVRLPSLLWPGTKDEIRRQWVAHRLVGALGDLPPTRLLPYLDTFDGRTLLEVIDLLGEQPEWDAATRETMIQLACSGNAQVWNAAIHWLQEVQLQPEEAPRLECSLTRKDSALRSGMMAVLLTQTDNAALESAGRLLDSKNANQRLAGLELLRQLVDQHRSCSACIAKVRSWQADRGRFSDAERTHLSELLAAHNEVPTLDDSLGLLNPSGRSAAIVPKARNVKCISRAAVAIIKGLDQLIDRHCDLLVRFNRWGHQDEETEELLGNIEHGFPYPGPAPIESQIEDFPVRELWQAWFEKRPKSMRDADGFELLRAQVMCQLQEPWKFRHLVEWLDESKQRGSLGKLLLGRYRQLELNHPSVVQSVVAWLLRLYPASGGFDFVASAVETTFARIPASDMRLLDRESDEFQRALDEGCTEFSDWREQIAGKIWVDSLRSGVGFDDETLTPKQQVRQWQLMRWRDEPFVGARRNRPGFHMLIAAYRHGAATIDDIADHLLGPDDSMEYPLLRSLSQMTSRGLTEEDRKQFAEYGEITQLLDSIRDRILEIELARGDTPTAASEPAWLINSLHGTDTLFKILRALDGEKFKLLKDSYRITTGRVETLTHLAQVTFPLPSDSVAKFRKLADCAIREGCFPEERILQLSFLAPQWIPTIQSYLGWDGYDEGLFWFLAHMQSVGGNQAVAAAAANYCDDETGGLDAWDRLIQQRTPLSDDDREEGAIDIAWFQQTYKRLGAKRWEAIAEAARFASGQGQATRAKLIADVLRGKTSRQTLIDGIRKRRLKDYVRLLGLLPLATGPKATDDARDRYLVLHEYRRYAAGLSSLTREDALRATQIGLQNLASLAGYSDPLRLEWAMEDLSTADLTSGSLKCTSGGITMELLVDDSGDPCLEIQRGEKRLVSLPKSHQKRKPFVQLKDRQSQLRQQRSRIRSSLEAAMCQGDLFSGAELQQISKHPLLAPMIRNLILVGENCMGYPVNSGKALQDDRGKKGSVRKKDRLRIAHPLDLWDSGNWDRWLGECFDCQRQQPFKQVFRELYVLTRQERTGTVCSGRYAGHMVNRNQALAIWGRRGWKTDSQVWKPVYDEQINASVTLIEDDRQLTLTIDTVSFHRRDQPKAIPLKEVPPRVFSEIMRDLDLVVSVAHCGGFDPEASASTIEMRSHLVSETCRLLKLSNVDVKKSHVMIRGQLARYSVHLGSGVVHRKPGGAISIVPVQGPSHGPLFLPFADEDPRTAEVISKILLLARDHEIADPSILEQLRRV